MESYSMGKMDRGQGMDAPEESESPDESKMEGGDEKTVFIEPEMLPPGTKAEPGDILKFKVVGKTADGKIQIECAEGGEDGQWADGLKQEGVF
jgi:hypothetical protein